MESINRKEHWENIYQTKELTEVSWYQPTPETSLNFFKKFDVPTNTKIIDIGGGDSFLVDHLLELGYQDITVLDISTAAIDRAKKRLGTRASEVKWIVADASDFTTSEQYDFWHDRAAFHFLTDEKEISSYIEIAYKYISSNGTIVIGTFSEKGPTKCSGIDIKQYSDKTMTKLFGTLFEKIDCKTIDHQTPSGSIQNFTFCSFRKV
jgi:ubiquinone/menaquinone biosynthesis C-methylase UbiE